MGALQVAGDPRNAVLSTSTALIPLRQAAGVCHDVNGYYRALGVAPTATRRELMLAYRARGGQDDPYLTYVLHQLLDARTRARYDGSPPGSPFVDRYVIARWRRQAEQIAARYNAENGTSITAADIIESLGAPSGEPKRGFLASDSPGGFDDDGTRDRQPSPGSSGEWPYSYLLVDSTCDDVARLGQWQRGLGRALADLGIQYYAVGFHGASHLPFHVLREFGAPILLLHEKARVTEELIAAAATAAVG